MRRLLFLAGVAIALASLGREARADEKATPTVPETTLPSKQPNYWARGENRLFASAMIDVGYLYLRPRITVGYGKPFLLWAGLDANPIATSSGLGAYAGLRLQVPWFDLRVGARGFRAFEHHFLAPQGSYETVDLQNATGPLSQYVTLEAELSGAIPVGPGSILLVLTAASVQGVPSGWYVYEETLHAITNPPGIYRARFGYGLRLGSEGNARVGLVGEALDLPGRREVVFRAGVVAGFTIDDHLEALGLLLVPVAGVDSLGIAAGDYGEFGIRYRWATF
jgi:hypothetical protein